MSEENKKDNFAGMSREERQEKYNAWMENISKAAFQHEPVTQEFAEALIERFARILKMPAVPPVVVVDGPIAALRKFKEVHTKVHGEEPSQEEIKRQLYAFNYGYADAPYIALFEYLIERGEEAEQDVSEYIRMLPHVGWTLVYDEIAIVIEKPVELHLLDRLPHNTEGPAIQYKDGTKLYAFRGQVIPPHFIEEKDKITTEMILKEGNQEFRRILLALIGPEKFIKDGGAKLLDESHWGKLWKIVLPVDGDEDVEIYMVEVINSSPEPDGSYKTYMLSVAPEDPFGKPMKTALQAVASTFGVSGEEYASGLQLQETLTGSASQT